MARNAHERVPFGRLEQLLRRDRGSWCNAGWLALRGDYAQHRLIDTPKAGGGSRVDDAGFVQLYRAWSCWFHGNPTSPAGLSSSRWACWGTLYRINRVWARHKLKLRAIHGLVDRIFHNLVPVVASVILLAGGKGLLDGAAFAPFAVAGSSTLLLVSGIYRTWGETLALIGTEETTT